MKTRQTALSGFVFSLPLALFLQIGAQAQTNRAPGSPPAAEPPPPPAAARTLYYTYSFSFPGGSPRDLLASAEKMYQDVTFGDLKVPADANWPAGWEGRLREAEEELHAAKVDWLSIADIPKEMGIVRVPRLRFNLNFLLLDGRLEWHRHRASGGEEGMGLLNQVRNNLDSVVTLYNKLGQEKTELGQLLVVGDRDKPSAVVLVPDKSSMATQPQTKVKAFSLEGIPQKSLDSLIANISSAQQQADEYSATYGIGRAVGRGMVKVHADTHLLIATGPESYVEMVESVVEAYRPKGPQVIDMLKPSNEK